MIRATPDLRRFGARLFGICIVSLLTSISTPIAASEVSCDEIGLGLDMPSSEEAQCWKGYGGEGSFRTEWESIELIAGDRLIAVEVQRVTSRGSFYRPALEEIVAQLFWRDVVDATWGTGVSHPDYTARQVELELDDGDTLPCFGFLHSGMGPYGGSKRVLYGLVCNLNGLAFSQGEAAEILNRIRE